MNIFEGTRRITKLMALLWTIGWVVAAIMMAISSPPSVKITYKITGQGAAPIRITDECPSNSETSHKEKITKSGTKAWITLCFFPLTLRDDSRLIKPSRLENARQKAVAAENIDDASILADEIERQTLDAQFESLIQIEAMTKAFEIPKTEEAWIDGQFWPVFLKESADGAAIAVIGLFLLWGFSWATGWVVRGFIGIPQGEDQRQSPSPVEKNELVLLASPAGNVINSINPY